MPVYEGVREKAEIWDRLNWLFLGIIATVAIFASNAVQAADPFAGKALALKWCAACHLVAEDQTSVSGASLPSFFDIANDPDWSRAQLTTFLADPHPKMPNMTLGNSEIANLASYIESLKSE